MYILNPPLHIMKMKFASTLMFNIPLNGIEPQMTVSRTRLDEKIKNNQRDLFYLGH